MWVKANYDSSSKNLNQEIENEELKTPVVIGGNSPVRKNQNFQHNKNNNRENKKVEKKDERLNKTAFEILMGDNK